MAGLSFFVLLCPALFPSPALLLHFCNSDENGDENPGPAGALWYNEGAES